MSNVKSLFNPNVQRIAQVSRWFLAQAAAGDHVCALSVSLTADNEIHTSGVAIEPEHAQVMLPALRALIQRIESQLPEVAAPVAKSAQVSNVVALRR